MDEQSLEASLAADAIEPGEDQPPERPREQPISVGAAVLLVVVGALAILALFALLTSANPRLNPFLAATPTPAVDNYAGVRQIAQESFERGKQYFEQGQLDLALIEFDRASVNDPDNRQDIQEWLQKTVDAIRARDARTVEPVASQATPVPPGPLPTLSPQAGFDVYRSDEFGIAILFPSGWKRVDSPRTDVGQGLVQFSDASGEARFTVARDRPPSDVSPELYAATIETQMQTLPGYMSEQVQLVNIGMLPGVKRVFRLDGRSPSGREAAVRGMQTVIGASRMTYILTGESGASSFDSYRDEFEAMANSFRTR